MNKYSIIALVFIVSSCAKTKNDEQPITSESKQEVITSKAIEESYHMVDDTYTIITDTLLLEGALRVTISNVLLDTYVTQTYDTEEKTKIDYYQDTNKRITVFHDKKQCVDTTFSKNSFENHIDKDFILNATFDGYSLDSYDPEKSEIKFFGTLTKPETDWTFAFYHIFSFTKNKVTLEPYIEEQI